MPYRTYNQLDPRRYTTYLSTKLGRRGAILSLLGVLWIFQGLSTYLLLPEPDYILLQGNKLLRLSAWVITGAIAIFHARKRQGSDAPGFLALYIMAAFRLLAYGYGFIQWIFGSAEGNPRGVVGLLVWVTIVSLIMVAAGWRESEERSTVDVDGDR